MERFYGRIQHLGRKKEFRKYKRSVMRAPERKRFPTYSNI